jgi:hypothetical protein
LWWFLKDYSRFDEQVWAAGRTRAQQAINLYANLDYLRPYFDVEPKEVVQRYEKTKTFPLVFLTLY